MARSTRPNGWVRRRAGSTPCNDHLRKTIDLAYDPLAGDNPRQIIIGLAPADAKRREAVRGEIIAWLKSRPEVAAVFPAEEIARSAPPPGKPVAELTLAERFYESYDPERSGDVMVAYVERSTLGMPLSPADTVAGHGSPWDHDRQVPILIWWPGVAPVQEPTPMETVDIAPTLAAMLKIRTPPIDGRCVDVGQGCP
jgi:hypothetical protein